MGARATHIKACSGDDKRPEPQETGTERGASMHPLSLPARESPRSAAPHPPPAAHRRNATQFAHHAHLGINHACRKRQQQDEEVEAHRAFAAGRREAEALECCRSSQCVELRAVPPPVLGGHMGGAPRPPCWLVRSGGAINRPPFLGCEQFIDKDRVQSNNHGLKHDMDPAAYKRRRRCSACCASPPPSLPPYDCRSTCGHP